MAQSVFDIYGVDYVNSECPIECQSVVYQLSTSFSQMSSKSMLRRALASRPNYFRQLFNTEPKSITESMFKQAFANVFIYYDELVITDVTSSPSQTLALLIPNLAGSMGFFFGLSFVTIVEFFEIFLIFCFIIFRHLYSKYYYLD